jgi:ketosteroid isomerase-like protein
MIKNIHNIAEEMLLQFCNAYNKRDLEATLKLFTQNSTIWGTGKDEYVVGVAALKDQLKREWSQAEKSEIQLASHLISGQEDSLWAAGIFTTSITVDGITNNFHELRGTIILAKEDGKWKIAHMHSSFPDIRQHDGESFPDLTTAIAKK